MWRIKTVNKTRMSLRSLSEWPNRMSVVVKNLFKLRGNPFLLVSLLMIQLSLLPIATAQHRPNQPPIFSNGGDLARFSIPEDSPVGSVIYRLKGTDPENGELTYSISGEYFRVNRKTGDLTLIKALDREVEPSIDVIISLTDDGHGSEPSTVSLRREIVIEDRNDNPPQFNKRPYAFDVSERTKVGSTVFSDILITDDDWAKNAEISLTCAQDDTPLACRTFSVSAEQVDEGKYVGIITLAAPLDFEKTPTYSLLLRATDGDNVVTAPVTITILDIQDARPNFLGGPYVFNVRENSPMGTPVGNISVQDGDTGNPRDLQLKLIDEAGNNYFRLSSIHKDLFTGIFSAIVETAENNIDAEDEFIRENVGVYELILEAREYPLGPDDTEPTLVTRTAVAVVIEDDDDFVPTFTPSVFSQVFKVPYNPNEAFIFPDFIAGVEDMDVDPSHSKFFLKFDWTDSTPAPHISPTDVFAFVTPYNQNPVIQSKGMITMEVLNISLLQPGVTFDLEIGAYQNDHLVSKINVPIEVARGPKSVPKFNNTVFRIRVSEDILEGDTITQISTVKPFPGMKYTLIGIGAERFEVEEATGVIKCGRKCVDYEKEKHHLFLVKAKAGDAVEDTVFAVLNIDVLETNDNYPVFEQMPGSATNQVRRSIPDGTDKFDPPFIIRATDADLGDRISYSVHDYSLNNSGIFIDPETGELKLSKPLKWSESGEHKLVVNATDASGKTAEQVVILIVQAVQNLQPSFPYKVHKVEIPETTEMNSPIFKAIAHDPDGQDAAIRYQIASQPEADLFLVEENSGVIRLTGKLDFEQKSRVYPVVIRAQDEGKPAETAVATIEIHVTDENDEDPKFTKRNFVTDLSESEMPEYSVLKLAAWDPDEDSELEYDISCPCRVWDGSGSQLGDEDAENAFNNFRVEPYTGEIILIGSVAYKKSSTIEFVATVKDTKGMKPQSDNTTVTVHVLVAERTKPIFGPPWSPGNPWINVTVPENIENGSTIVTFNAFDYIAGEHISRFSLVESDSDNFDLEGNELTTVGILDYEYKKEFFLAVKAEDARGGESIANVRIELQDVNDNTAVFSKQEYRGKVKENAEYPTPILTVEATDRDDPDNYGAVRYALVGPSSNLFQIDEFAGVIQVAPGAMIDREKMSEHFLTVLAIDTPAGGPFQKTASATVKIQVEDENDLDPVCAVPDILVPENTAVATAFAIITCTDEDLNTTLKFTLKDELNLNLFSIDAATGKLSTAKGLRGRGRTSPYIVQVMVEDGKERTISLAVPIIVTNVIPNDGKPRFTNENLTAIISEGAHRSSPIIQIKAEDTDSFDNGEGRLSFKILKQIYPCQSMSERESENIKENPLLGIKMTQVEDIDYFRLDEQTGMLSLKEKVDRERYECFSLLISVEDLGTPPQMDSQWFEILIQDIDDNMPFLPKNIRNLELKVNETTPKGTAIYNFTGQDDDVHPNNRITFEIAGGGSDLFKLQPLGDQNVSLVLNGDLTLMDHSDITLVIKCHPKEKRISIPDCVSKIHISVVRDLDNINYLARRGKMPELILGVASGAPVGNLVGNAHMPIKKFQSSTLMYHPNVISQAPYNTTGVLKIDHRTGDILVWENLDKYQNGHFRVEMSDMNGTTSLRKNVKVFVAPNDQLLNADTADFARLSKWVDDADRVLNLPSKDPKVTKGLFKVLTFDQNNAPEGKTKICFQLLENEHMISQDKAMHLLEEEDLQVLFLKYSFDSVQKGCPAKPRIPARLTAGATTGRFWVERSLLGIASVVAIATISAIVILCLVNRHRGKDGH